VAFRVTVGRRALTDLRAIFLWKCGRARSTVGPQRWYTRLRAAIQSPEHSPERCGFAAEDEWYDGELRELIHGKRRQAVRVLFEIRDDEVVILRVRHANQDYLGADEL
jgi:plasmid stabilization system protein ParE